MKKIADYINGNAHIVMYEDGTRIMETDDVGFNFKYPTNNDVTITHKCSQGCPYCYLGCTPEGKHADLSAKFLDTINAGAELAINLNDMDHPQLDEFLERMKSQGVFVNGTVNQAQFMVNYERLKRLCREKLLWGVGVSLREPDDEFISKIQEFPNAVIHVINGILKPDDIEKLRDRGLKLLILGYKDLNRGVSYREENSGTVSLRQRYLKDVLASMVSHFACISFDNLAIEQLNVRETLKDFIADWDEVYQGDEGSSTFAVDLVDGTFGVNSMATGDDTYLIMDDIRDMFKVIKSHV